MNSHSVDATIYTPIECLFLFQLIAKYGLRDNAFTLISEELNHNGFIREQSTYHAPRLSPEPLRALALQVLRDEQGRESESTTTQAPEGSLSPNSRKRKLQSSPLPTLAEAQLQLNKLPILVNRLYARYRDFAIAEIREDERRYNSLTKEVVGLEDLINREKVKPPVKSAIEPIPKRPNGQLAPTATPAPTPPSVAKQQDVSQVSETPARAPTPASVAPPVPQQQNVSENKPVRQNSSAIPATPRVPSEAHMNTPESRAQDMVRPPSATASPVLQHPQQAPRPGSSTPQPPTADNVQRPDSIPKSQPQAASASQVNSPQAPLKWEPPYQPVQQTPVPSPRLPYPVGTARPPQYNVPPQPPATTQYPQSQQTYAADRQPPGPIIQPARVAPNNKTKTTTPVLVPPQNAGQIPPPPQPLPRNPTPDGVAQKSSTPRPPINTAGSPASGVSPAYPPNKSHLNAPTSPARPSPVPPSVSKQPARPHAPSPARPLHPAQPSVPTTPVIQPPQFYPQQGRSRPGQPQFSAPLPQHAGLPHPQTPIAAPQLPRVTPLPQTPVGNTPPSHVLRGHGTKWLSTPTPATPRMDDVSSYFDIQSPAFEPLSPPPPRPAQLPKKSPENEKRDPRRVVQAIDTSVGKARSHRNSRSAQNAPSTDELLSDADGSGRKIKDEVATPRALEDASEMTADETVPDRGMSVESKPTNNKRKRHETPTERTAPAPATHVLWTRSFHKVSSSALEQVISHRHANMFATAVKEREAPGYKNIVLRPQDLNGIKRAINQGSRAANAAASALLDFDPNTSPMHMWLPISVDLVPPRGIINIAQLERELVHMFANAIMYAPDPDRGIGPTFKRKRRDGEDSDGEDEVLGYEVDEDGIVKDTRSMFVEVEKLLGDLRNELDRNAPPPVTTMSRSMSLAGGDVSMAEDDGDEHAGDTKRRRVRG